MHPVDPDDPLTIFALDQHVPAQAQGIVILGYLEGLGKVGIVVVLPVKESLLLDDATQGQSHPDGILYGFLVYHRQGARQSQTDRAGVGVRVVVMIVCGTAAEELRVQLVELDMDLQPDDYLVLHIRSPPAVWRHDGVWHPRRPGIP